MASQVSEESMKNTNLGGKPLNPYAKEFYPQHVEISRGPGFYQMPPWAWPSYGPICTYLPCFGRYKSVSKGLKEEVAAPIPEYKAEEDVGKRMIGNTETPKSMFQKRNLPKEHGSVEKKLQKGGHHVYAFPTSFEECKRSRTTTVMIKNIPYHYQVKDLLLILDAHCSIQNQNSRRAYFSMYDFVYLPMDYGKYAFNNRLSNLGYAFVNFTSARAAFRFFQQFHGQKWVGDEDWKVCEVAKAVVQGKMSLKKKFEEKVFRCCNPSFRPVEFMPARGSVYNHGMKEIWLGKFEDGLPSTGKGKPWTLPMQ